MTLLSAAERMDTSVLKFSIAISLIFLAVLVLLHFLGTWSGKAIRRWRRRKARLSPELPPHDFATDLDRARVVLIAPAAGDADTVRLNGAGKQSNCWPWPVKASTTNAC